MKYLTLVRKLEKQARHLCRLKQTKRVKQELREVYVALHKLQAKHFIQPITFFRSSTGVSNRKLEKRYLGKCKALSLQGIKPTKADYKSVLPKTKITKRY